MIHAEIWHGDGQRTIAQFDPNERILIGRKPSAGICLANDFVSSEHAELFREGGKLFIRAMGTNPTWVDGAELPDDQPVEIASGSVITIRSFRVRVLDGTPARKDSGEAILVRISEIERNLYEGTFQRIDFRRVGVLPDEVTEDGCKTIRPAFEAAFEELVKTIHADSDVCRVILSRLFLRLVLNAVSAPGNIAASATGRGDDVPLRVFLSDPEVLHVRDVVAEEVRAQHLREVTEGRKISESEVAMEIWNQMAGKVEALVSVARRNELVREECFRRVVNLSFGLGPLQDLLDLPGATEILVVGPDRIYVETGSGLRRTGDRFPSAPATRRILERAVSKGGRRIDTSQPLVDVQLPDGSRLNAIIAPLSRCGDVLSIRRFSAKPIVLQDLIENESIPANAARFLDACIQTKKNIVVSGGTGSGKTTLLGALAAQVDPADRLIIIEDTAEIRLPDDMHAVFLQSRPSNVEGKGEVSIRQLVRNALRMRPDRLIVGESRGAEVIDMLQAMNTGHPGSLTTVHANSAEEVIARIELMVLQGADLPIAAIRRQVASSIDLIVQVERVGDGGRHVAAIAEVFGYDERRNVVEVVPIYERDDKSHRLLFTGWLPSFVTALEATRKFSVEDCYAQ